MEVWIRLGQNDKKVELKDHVNTLYNHHLPSLLHMCAHTRICWENEKQEVGTEKC